MDCNKYVTTIPYPNKAAYTKTFYYKEGVCIATAVDGVVEWATTVTVDTDLAKCVKDSVFDRVSFEKARDVCMAEQAAMEARFKKDLLVDLGITNNPRADKLYAKAYQMGHSSGFNEIYCVASDLVELIT